ncbi:hypothetical protein BDV38DRAFT_241229 [Aspergillus pseudotamarii]|uniref:NACHT-NTPase and P-loop NTPases N-terminal domain-containing protein n=1 Tax=Aspergillus pseudotamarii TaxID=132259 RepID=A0A5N6T0F4_ASPPS|nr:uncharacterized protein BDV38DRAFT_241229 [Aspergillus pseudotamarii]KAE8139807.1 hypothetical protein BDV38DRAFT_241229 [Aspergillus pseudotamarii]
MMGAHFSSLLSSVITTLSSTKQHYNIVKDDKRLPATFHEAGQGLLVIEDALRCVERNNDGRDIAGEPKHAMGLLEACNCKAKLSEAIFLDVAQGRGSDRFEDYKMAVRGRGKGSPIEALVTGMMNDVCQIANDSTIEAAMKVEIISLRTALEWLSKMEPSVSNEQPGSHFSNYGSGNQFNTTGGTQNNNIGNGNQFPGASFSGTVNFGSNH